MSVASAVELRNVTVTFNRGTPDQVVALRDFSLRIEPSEFLVVVGSNGSGKSTLLRAIAGTVPLMQGQVLLDDTDVTRERDCRRARSMTFVHQDPLLGTCPNLTLYENMMLVARNGKWFSPFPYSTSSYTCLGSA